MSGGQARLVTPPATAAAISEASVALYSSPGSRRRAERSIRPGHTTMPAASMIRLACQPSGAAPTAATLPAAMYSADTRSMPCRGSIRRPLRISIFTAQFPASMDSTAIRTAMPKVTCGRITARALSATAESISMPRFIGPGCITIASGFAYASFSGVSP